MAEEEEKGGSSLKISLGKEIDAALGDVIRGLLMKPAEEAGNLIADGIGILGDRVRKKREINAQLGMEEVRKKLESDGVDMKDITPPEEEELHLLINGMSLAGDETVRDMWAGLFAKALEPNSRIAAERPFLSVLESLSPMDAKIIDFLAFVERHERTSQADMREALSPKSMSLHPSKEAQKHREAAWLEIRQKLDGYGLGELTGGGWGDNLFRQGLIEVLPSPAPKFSQIPASALGRVDTDAATKALWQGLSNVAKSAGAGHSRPRSFVDRGPMGDQYKISVKLTSFGRSLAEACGLL